MLSYAGMVIRDNLGRVFGSQSVLTSHVPTTFVAEALACFHAIHLVLDIGLQKVTIEGDSLTMIRKIWFFRVGFWLGELRGFAASVMGKGNASSASEESTDLSCMVGLCVWRLLEFLNSCSPFLLFVKLGAISPDFDC
ncbi:hypothetical protein Gotur_025482 [Gossypium turneri]